MAQWVKDLVLLQLGHSLQLWLGVSPWTKHFRPRPLVWEKKKKKKKKEMFRIGKSIRSGSQLVVAYGQRGWGF